MGRKDGEGKKRKERGLGEEGGENGREGKVKEGRRRVNCCAERKLQSDM